MTFGLNDEDWQIVHDLAIKKLHALGCRIWVFGSRARGTHRPFSDLDLYFLPSRELPPGLLSEIKEALEESPLPIKVDLIAWNDLADDYRANILQDRREIC